MSEEGGSSFLLHGAMVPLVARKTPRLLSLLFTASHPLSHSRLRGPSPPRSIVERSAKASCLPTSPFPFLEGEVTHLRIHFSYALTPRSFPSPSSPLNAGKIGRELRGRRGEREGEESSSYRSLQFFCAAHNFFSGSAREKITKGGRK